MKNGLRVFCVVLSIAIVILFARSERTTEGAHTAYRWLMRTTVDDIEMNMRKNNPTVNKVFDNLSRGRWW